MLNIHLLIFTLFLVLGFVDKSYASSPETFGAAPASSGLGNQPTLSSNDPGNGFYAPALMSFSDRTSVSLNSSHTISNFDDINNIVIENSTNSGLSGTDVTRGSANTDYSGTTMGALHASLPLAYENAGHLVFNVFTPLGKFAEVNSGDAFLPEYVMHRARYKRTQVFISYVHPLGQSWAFSLGTILGLQAGADIGTQATLTGADYGSSGRIKSEVKPSLGASFSLAHKDDNSQTFFSYHQEMRSNLRSEAAGEINDPISSLFTIDIESMIYFDPHTFRLGHAQSWDGLSLHAMLEYQVWDNYQTPVVKISNRGGVLKASDDYEKTETKNILVPKIGLSFELGPNWDWSLGGSYRPTPLDGNFSGAGNSVDLDSVVGATGLRHQRQVFGRDVEISSFIQYHHYFEKDVTKSAGQENGDPGQKLGAPGYKLSGYSLAAGLGLTLLF